MFKLFFCLIATVVAMLACFLAALTMASPFNRVTLVMIGCLWFFIFVYVLFRILKQVHLDNEVN
jgi:MFS-type transporter involved in bile tolerance (Atg22 family)